MSLLNEALRKKDKNLDRTRDPHLFRNKPKGPGLKKILAYGGVIVFIGLSALIYTGGWHAYLLPDALTRSPKITTAKMLKPASPASPSEKLSESVKEKTVEEKTVLEPKLIASAAMEKQTPENENGIVQEKETSESSPKPVIKSLKKNTAVTKKPSEKKQKPAIQRAPMTSQAEKAPNPFYEKALNYHRQNDIAEAIRMYQQVVSKDPDHTDAMFNLAAAYMASSRFEEAYPLLKKLKDRDPDNPQVLLNLAVAEIGLGRYHEAISILNMAGNQKDQPQFEVYFNLGVAFSRLEKPEDAIQWYKKAAALQPKHPRLLFNMAVSHDKLQYYPDAIRYYDAFLTENLSSSLQEKKGVANRIRTLKAYLAGQTK